MVDLPGYSENVVTLRAPQSSVTRSEIAEPYTELAATLKTAGDSAESAAESLAKQAGLRAVTTDANGNIQVEKMPILGPASKFAADGIKVGALAMGEGAIRRNDIDLRQKFRDDPQGYLKASNEYNETMQKQYADAAGPEVGFAVRKAAESITTTTFRGLLNEHEHLELARSVNAINSEMEFAKNQMYALAGAGDTDSPEFKRLSQKVISLYDTVSSNPRLAYPREKVDFELSQFNSELKVRAAGFHAEQTLMREGPDAAMREAEKIRTDTSLNLSPQQRDVAYSRVTSMLASRMREDERMVRGVSAQIQSVTGQALEGYPITPDQMAGLRDQVQATKRPELDAALAQTTQIVQTMQQWRTLSAPQLEQVLAGLEKTMRGQPGRENLEAAVREMNLTPQERALYERHLKNLTGPGGVTNPDGSRSSLFQMSFERDGKTYNIPTVWDGKILPPDEAIKRAEKEGLDKFPSYKNEAEAEARYQKMHDFMEKDTAAFLHGGATEIGTEMLKGGNKLLASMRTEIGKDPLGWADRTGTMQVPPIEFGGQDQLGQMADRASRAETIAGHYGVAPTYLRPDEKHALQVVAAKGGDPMLGLAKTLVAGFGDRAPRVMAEISHDAPALAHVGALIQSGGNPVFAMDVADALKLRADPEESKKLPKWLSAPSDKVQQGYVDHAKDIYGTAFTLAPDSRRAAERAAQDAFFTRAYRNGYGPLSDDALAKDAYDTALKESAGGRKVEGNWYGGVADYKPGFWTNYKVLVPQNVRADRFRDAVGAVTQDDLDKMGISPMAADGRKYTPSDLRGAVPVAVKGGYRFSLGDPAGDDPKFIRGADGKPWVLDFDQMSERLRTRVPGAFLGGGGRQNLIGAMDEGFQQLEDIAHSVKINPAVWDAAVKSFPSSTNIEDRRDELGGRKGSLKRLENTMFGDLLR